MATKSQRKATRTHRRRQAARGLVRVEIQAAKKDVGLIRAMAETLRRRNPSRSDPRWPASCTVPRSGLPSICSARIFPTRLFRASSVSHVSGIGSEVDL